MNESDSYTLVFDKGLLSYIAEETNRYYDAFINSTILREYTKKICDTKLLL